MKEEERLSDFFTYIRMLSKLLFRLKSNAVKKLGLKSVHVQCLFYLSYKGNMTFSNLVKLTLEDKASVSKALKILTDKDIVSYHAGYNEEIVLTEEGKKVASEIEKESITALKEARKDIPDEDARIFVSTLKKICMNLREYVED